MRTISIVVAICGLVAQAHAQPGPDQPPQPPPNIQFAPPAYAYQPPAPIEITSDERDMLERGEISNGRILTGGLVSTFVGYGIGQAIEGRWTDTGWLFSVGETAASVAMVVGLARMTLSEEARCLQAPCSNSSNDAGLFVGSLIALTALRIWDSVDAFAGPHNYNEKLGRLRARVGVPPPVEARRVVPFVAPPNSGAGTVAGLALQF